jgi:phosphonopyruvate decarboxylase
MVAAAEVVNHLRRHGLGPCIGVPCSFLKPLINYVIEHEPGEYLAANNEGEAIAIAAGAYLAGRSPVVMFQNSGLGNAINPLTSLNQTFKIPVLIITTWRGQPNCNDEPQHQLMGRITEPMLELMEIPHEHFPQQPDQLAACFEMAVEHLRSRKTPFAFILRKNTVAEYALSLPPRRRHVRNDKCKTHPDADSGERIFRREAIETLINSAPNDTLAVATTGKTARELCELRDRNENFYVVGSMGCASSIALGIALCQPKRKVIVLDGDGAALMRLEAMVSIGSYAPPNLTHVILDNESYESTGGQQTLSSSVDFPQLAISCGYQSAYSSNLRSRLAEFIAVSMTTGGPHLIHFKIRPGSDANLKRPALAPTVIAQRFRAACLQSTGSGGCS